MFLVDIGQHPTVTKAKALVLIVLVGIAMARLKVGGRSVTRLRIIAKFVILSLMYNHV